ncbi:MAG: hypothetical protein ACI4KF_12125 [Huintestinicola sp.]
MMPVTVAEVFVYSIPSSMSWNNPTAGEFAATYINMISVFAEMFAVINAVWICTMDFGDKTASYELMTGHTRLQVFSARIVMSLITGISGYLLLIIIPVIIAAILWGWGSCIYLSDMIFRWFMLIFPIARIIMEFSFLGFIIRKPAPAIILSFVINEFLTIVPINTGMNSTSCILGTSNLSKLVSIDSWATYGLEKLYFTFDPMLPTSYIASTIAASVIASAVFFCLGYTFFRYDDID